MEMRNIVITGVSGQDGTYLALQILQSHEHFVVHGIVRSKESNPNLEHLSTFIEDKRLRLHHADITDAHGISLIMASLKPVMIFHLAAQSDVHSSFQIPGTTIDTNIKGFVNILESVRLLDNYQAKIFVALTSELFGEVPEGTILNEESPMNPESPYAITKKTKYQLIKVYRKAYKNMHICSAISFNHESPLRGKQFVTRKVTNYVSRVKLGLTNTPLLMGNINAVRDWGHSRDYVRAYWQIMMMEDLSDYVVCTGIAHSVRDLLQLSFKLIGIDLTWKGKALNEVGFDPKTDIVYVAYSVQMKYLI